MIDRAGKIYERSDSPGEEGEGAGGGSDRLRDRI